MSLRGEEVYMEEGFKAEKKGWISSSKKIKLKYHG